MQDVFLGPLNWGTFTLLYVLGSSGLIVLARGLMLSIGHTQTGDADFTPIELTALAGHSSHNVKRQLVDTALFGLYLRICGFHIQ